MSFSVWISNSLFPLEFLIFTVGFFSISFKKKLLCSCRAHAMAHVDRKLGSEISGSKVWTCEKGIRLPCCKNVTFSSSHALPWTHPFFLAIKCDQKKEHHLSDELLFQRDWGSILSHIQMVYAWHAKMWATQLPENRYRQPLSTTGNCRGI